MLSRKLVKTDGLKLKGRSTPSTTSKPRPRAERRGTAPRLVLGPGDRIIVDGSSLGALEWRVARLMPATLYSRMLARAAA